MEEQLISFNVAKLAKEKNCDLVRIIPEDQFNGRDILSPTQSLLQRWLRDKHNIHLDVWYNSLTEKYRLETIHHNNNEYEFDEPENNYEIILEMALEKALLLIKK